MLPDLFRNYSIFTANSQLEALLSSDIYNKELGLFELLRSGDTKAFARIHELYKTRLVYFALKLMNDRDAAEDIISEAFLLLWQSRAKIRSDQHLRNFLFITVRHRTINYLESKQRQVLLMDEISDDITAVESIDPLEVQAEMFHLLKLAIHSLPDEYRNIIDLAYNQSLSPAEIAKLLQMNPSTVRTKKQRALQLVRDWIFQKKALLLWLAAFFTLSFIFF